jgi:hypothetical protein
VDALDHLEAGEASAWYRRMWSRALSRWCHAPHALLASHTPLTAFDNPGRGLHPLPQDISVLYLSGGGSVELSHPLTR